MGKLLVIKDSDFSENAIENVALTNSLTQLSSYGNHLEVAQGVATFNSGANWNGGFIDLHDIDVIEFVGAGQLRWTSSHSIPVYAFFSSLPDNSSTGAAIGYIENSEVYADTASTVEYPNVIGSKKVIMDSINIPENARYLWINNCNLDIGKQTYYKYL